MIDTRTVIAYKNEYMKYGDDSLVPDWDLPAGFKQPPRPLDIENFGLTYQIAKNFTGLVKRMYDAGRRKGLDHQQAFKKVMNTEAGRKQIEELRKEVI